MNSVTHNEPADRPNWVSGIKEEVHRKVRTCTLTAGCRQGDHACVKALVIGFWPFVDAFPGIIKDRYLNVSDTELDSQARVMQRAAQILARMENDERSHRDLWLCTAEAMGLDPTRDLVRNPLAEITALIEQMRGESDLATVFLCFVAVEMVAETLSQELLASEAFCDMLNERGKVWFKVHVAHEGTTHEQIAFRLAMAHYRDEDTPGAEKINAIIQQTVDLFCAGGEACRRELAG